MQIRSFQTANPRLVAGSAIEDQKQIRTGGQVAFPEFYLKEAQLMINLYRTFHQLTGMTFTRYIAKLRLAIARDKLLDSPLRVQDIAVSVGFGDVNTFIRLFRHEFGQTPLHYRRKQLLANDSGEK